MSTEAEAGGMGGMGPTNPNLQLTQVVPNLLLTRAGMGRSVRSPGELLLAYRNSRALEFPGRWKGMRSASSCRYLIYY